MDSNWLYVYDCRDESGAYGGNRGFKQIECVQRYPKPAVFPAPKASFGWIRGHLESIYAFVANVAEDKPASPSFAEALHVHEVMDAAQRSSAAGAWATVRNV
jgi:predicted dehydrogenase